MRNRLLHSNNQRVKALSSWLLLPLLIFLSGCLGLTEKEIPTAIPTEYLPTVIALTFEAGRIPEISPSETMAIANPTPVKSTPTSAITPTSNPTPTPLNTPIVPAQQVEDQALSSSPTPIPEIPNAEIEIRNLGPLSRVNSPISLYAYLKTGAEGRVRIELLGEDGRVLFREIKVVNYAPAGARAIVLAEIDFEIAAIAEAGRLQLSVDDEYGRTTTLNSVPLILLSHGDSDITPPFDLLAPIIIQQPVEKSLIQADNVLVSGLARPNSEYPLQVQLIAPDGQVVGHRLAELVTPAGNDYGHFAIEVAYQVDKTTNTRILVSQGESGINDIIHLSSIEVMLSP
jgi:hypothetical protein